MGEVADVVEDPVVGNHRVDVDTPFRDRGFSQEPGEELRHLAAVHHRVGIKAPGGPPQGDAQLDQLVDGVPGLPGKVVDVFEPVVLHLRQLDTGGFGRPDQEQGHLLAGHSQPGAEDARQDFRHDPVVRHAVDGVLGDAARGHVAETGRLQGAAQARRVQGDLVRLPVLGGDRTCGQCQEGTNQG